MLLLTALELEYEAVRALLTRVEERAHPAGTVFEVGLLPGGMGEAVIAVTGEGNHKAAVLAERGITMFRPRALLFVGVAGALKDEAGLGDVVVATTVYAYHGGKDEDDGFLDRPRAWDAPHELEQLARQLARTRSWGGLLGRDTRALPRVHFKPIAAGEVVLNSRDTSLAMRLRRTYSDAVAIDMEGAGVSQAGVLNGYVPVLVIRGISDRADGAKQVTDGEWQPAAAAHAAAFALTLSAQFVAQCPSRSDARDEHGPYREGVVRTASAHAEVTALPGVAARRQLAELAEAVERQWLAEVRAAGLSPSGAGLTSWAVTTRPVTAASPDAFPGGSGPGYGTPGELAAMFRTLPARRLVIIGGPGSGKTVMAMVLTVDLASGSRGRDEPTPVMFTISGWQPDREHLHSWLSRRIAEDYRPMMPGPAEFGHIADLISDGQLIPVLDGVDEMAGESRRVILDAINHMHGGLPLVLTCRTAEFEALVRDGGAALTDAAVVEIDPVSPGDAVGFLRSRLPASDARWPDVFGHLLRVTDSPLAQTLSTPLMVTLASDAYRQPSSRPGQMLDQHRFSSKESLERHLLQRFVTTAYNPIPRLRNPLAPRGCNAWKACRSLSTLARYLQGAGSPDLAWWDIAKILPHGQLESVSRVLIGLTAALAFGLGLDVWYGPGYAFSGVLLGLVLGVTSSFVFGLIGTAHQVNQGRSPRGAARILPWITYPLLAGLLSGASVSLAEGLAGGALNGVTAALIFLILFQPTIWLMRRVGLWAVSWRRHDQAPAAWTVGGNLRRLTAQLAYSLVATTAVTVATGLADALTSGGRANLISDAQSFLTVGLVSVLMLGLGLNRGDGAPERVNIRIAGRVREGLMFLCLGLWIGCLYSFLLVAVFAAVVAGTLVVASVAFGHLPADSIIGYLTPDVAVCLIVGMTSGIAAGTAGWLTTPVDLTVAPSPASVLRRARVAAVTWTAVCVILVVGSVVVGGLWSRPGSVTAYGGGLVALVSVLALTSNAWGKLRIAVGILAFRGDLPPGILQFLEDARHRGILRQAGPFYQFRHRQLQECLAETGNREPRTSRIRFACTTAHGMLKRSGATEINIGPPR